MKRPEKKDLFDFDPASNLDDAREVGQDEGYNQACSDWEAFLPSEEEIGRLLQIYLLPIVITKDTAEGIFTKGENVKSLAKAIYQRLNR